MKAISTKRAAEIYANDDFRSVGNRDLCILTTESGDLELAAMQDELEDYAQYSETSEETTATFNPADVLAGDIISIEAMNHLIQYLKSQDVLDPLAVET